MRCGHDFDVKMRTIFQASMSSRNDLRLEDQRWPSARVHKRSKKGRLYFHTHTRVGCFDDKYCSRNKGKSSRMLVSRRFKCDNDYYK